MAKKKRKKKSNLSNFILILFLIAGLSLLLYPTVSNWWNSFHATRAVANYDAVVADLGKEKTDELFKKAQEYNEYTAANPGRFIQTTKELEWYNSLLNPVGDGMMGYIEIPKINVNLPIYHGTSEAVLQVGVGHIEGSTLPIGGKGMHCAFSGHRGLPSARLFTDLDKITENDTFVVHTLDRVYTYQVDQIHIVEPTDIRDLKIERNKDYCTLVTCTPYGINSHRMMIRGKRVKNAKELAVVTSDAIQIEPNLVALIVAMPILLALLIALIVSNKIRKDRIRIKKNPFNE